jgi:hypothetical protein
VVRLSEVTLPKRLFSVAAPAVAVAAPEPSEKIVDMVVFSYCDKGARRWPVKMRGRGFCESHAPSQRPGGQPPLSQNLRIPRRTSCEGKAFEAMTRSPDDPLR